MAIAFQSLRAARAKLGAKTPVGSVLRSAEWERVPLALREAAQFSAGVESMRLLAGIQAELEKEIALSLEVLPDGRTRFLDRNTFVNRMRDLARKEGLDQLVDPARAGTLQDITSVPRLGLIHDVQKSRVEEFARWKMDQSEGALLLYPAQEFLRIEDRAVPRKNWRDRWMQAGGAVYEGRMVALKNDPVWAKLSRFGTPWPPYDYGSGMGIEDVDHDEAVRLGLITGDAPPPEPMEAEFNAQLEASVANIPPRFATGLKHFFGDQIEITDGVARWTGGAAA